MRIKHLLIAAVITFSFGCLNVQAQKVITRTTVAQGELEGIEEDGLGKFKAIPYAEPPVGELRWKAPVPIKKWEGVYKTDKFAPMPPQQTYARPGQEGPQWSEDCLYINVMTPATSKDEKLPVMVWIHGGGFITGNYTSPMGTKFAQQGVIYASIAYRTGALGFLALPELSKESERGISGNYGLMDQILALKWIKENIAAFGGDPDKITIFGESAGAIAVSMLCGSPEAKGLFSGAISQSGGSFCPVDSVRTNNNGIRDVKGAEAFGVEFMKRIGAKSLKELRKMSPEKWIGDSQSTGVGGFWPTVDGYVITDDQYKLYEQGKYNDVNVLIGTNSDEGSMFVRPSSVADYEAEVKKDFGPFADKMLKAYPATTEQETFFGRSDIFRETAFAWPTFVWADLQKKTGKSNVYVYYFDQVSDNGRRRGPVRGAGHAADLSYVFGSFWGEPTPTDKAVSDLMMTYWLNFAKTGNPNGEGLPHWPQFDKQKATVMKFKNGAHLIELPHQDKLQLMDDFYRWKREDWDSQGQNKYDRYFTDKSLRIDFSLSGNLENQSAAIQQVREEPVWGGPRKNLIDNFNYGGYYVNVYDKRTNALIYSRSFNTLFEEWRTTAQAQTETQSWTNSVSVPFPKIPVTVEITARDKKDMKFYPLVKTEVDPTSIFIDRGKLHENKVTQIQYKGNPAEKVDLVFLAEGYTAEEQAKFEADAKRFSESLFKNAPFDACRDDFNTWAVHLISGESGTDVSGKGVFKNTALNSGFYTFGVDRYLTTQDMKSIRDAVWNVPCDAVFILVNTDMYGGGGMYNFYAIGAADNKQTQDIFVHEFGHSFGALADEYYTSEVAYEDFYNLKYEPWEPNITTLVNFESKWKDMLPANLPIPTPLDDKHKDNLGVFEGGGYLAKGIYRPMDHCMMRDYAPFCPACSRAILRMVDFLTDK